MPSHDAPAHKSVTYKPLDECCGARDVHCDFARCATREEPCWGEVQIDGEYGHTCQGHYYFDCILDFSPRYRKEAQP